jgi:hypothetical protein
LLNVTSRMNHPCCLFLSLNRCTCERLCSGTTDLYPKCIEIETVDELTTHRTDRGVKLAVPVYLKSTLLSRTRWSIFSLSRTMMLKTSFLFLATAVGLCQQSATAAAGKPHLRPTRNKSARSFISRNSIDTSHRGLRQRIWTMAPSPVASDVPSDVPSGVPSDDLSGVPSVAPTSFPTEQPSTSRSPVASPRTMPSQAPSISNVSAKLTAAPNTAIPTVMPSEHPILPPSAAPFAACSHWPLLSDDLKGANKTAHVDATVVDIIPIPIAKQQTDFSTNRFGTRKSQDEGYVWNRQHTVASLVQCSYYSSDSTLAVRIVVVIAIWYFLIEVHLLI